MSLGIFMKAFNSLYFGSKVEFFFEFVPQILLLWCLFGWMDSMIVMKWLTPYGTEGYPYGDSPSIISSMINMFLNLGKPAGTPFFP
jgi:V-type H+-transporting ATPase subunit a